MFTSGAYCGRGAQPWAARKLIKIIILNCQKSNTKHENWYEKWIQVLTKYQQLVWWNFFEKLFILSFVKEAGKVPVKKTLVRLLESEQTKFVSQTN